MRARLPLQQTFLATLCCVAASAVAASAAQAAPDGNFGCYSAAVVIDGGGQYTAPLTGNGPSGFPCRPTSGNSTGQQASGAPGSATFVQGVVATTDSQHQTPQDGDNGTASTTVQHVVIDSGNTVIEGEVQSAQASVTCTAGAPVLSGNTSVSSVTVNGTPVTLTGGEQDVSTPAGTLHINDVYEPSSTLAFYRALWLQAPTGDIIAGEAAVAYSGSPCQLAPPVPPQPKPGPVFYWGCRATPMVIGNSSAGTSFEPLVENAKLFPCTNSAGGEIVQGLGNGLVADDGIFAFTASNPYPMPAPPVPNNAGVTAEAGMGHIDVGSGSSEVEIDNVLAREDAYCHNGKYLYKGYSEFHNILIGGKELPEATKGTTTVNLPDGGQVIFNYVDNIRPYGEERRAVWFHLPGGTDLIFGDAVAGINMNLNPCVAPSS